MCDCWSVCFSHPDAKEMKITWQIVSTPLVVMLKPVDIKAMCQWSVVYPESVKRCTYVCIIFFLMILRVT